MMKNTVDPMATQSGVLAALLAEKGYTGPEHVIDGKEGLVHCFGPEWKLNILTDGLGESWRITQCGMKFFPTEALTHTPISAVLDLVKNNDLKPEQIKEVHIRTTLAAPTFSAIPASTIRTPRKPPTTRCPTASPRPSPTARSRRCSSRWRRSWIAGDSRAVAEGEGRWRSRDRESFPGPAARHREDHHHGRTRASSSRLDFPKGDPRNPLSDREIEEKFHALAEPVMSKAARQKLIDAIWHLRRRSRSPKLWN